MHAARRLPARFARCHASAAANSRLASSTCEASERNLLDVLGALKAARVAVGRVYSEPPTLNDVFLEITGRELRD